MSLGVDVPTAIRNFLTSHDPLIELVSRIAVSLVVIVAAFWLSGLAMQRLRRTLVRSGLQVNAAILLARLLWIAIWVTGVMAVLYEFGIGLTPLVAFIGVVGLAASLALQQVLQNLVAGIYLLAERPFHIGDQIAVVGPSGANHEGTVEDIQMRTTHLRNRLDELILVPNSAIFSGVVTNRTAVGGYASHITVTFPRAASPSDVRARVVPLLQKLPGVLEVPPPELFVERVEKDDWTASLLFWSGGSTVSASAVWAIADAFPDATVNNGTES